MLQRIRQFQKDENGATAVEYVLLVVAIALIMVAGAFFLGSALNSKFSGAANCVSGTVAAPCAPAAGP